MAFEASVHAKAIELTKASIEMTTAAGSGHPTSAASLAHLVTILMYHHMRYDPADPCHPAADRLVLSEGHACPIIYAAAADLGIAIGRDHLARRPMTWQDALQLRDIDSEIDGHPNPAEGFPFFPAATGSLGQGLSIAAGLALAARLNGLDKRIFCLIGDGESREGQIWEALDFIIDYRLTAVCPIFNANAYGQSDAVSPQQSPTVTAAKLRAIGFDVQVIDGHNPSDIRQALTTHTVHCQTPYATPFAIVAQTVKGWGFASVMGSEVHGQAVPGGKKEAALAALDVVAQRVGAAWTAGDLQIAPMAMPAPPPLGPLRSALSFREALQQFGQEQVITQGKLATRKAYGLALRALGHARPDVVALDGDVRNSTYAEYFYEDPALRERFFECKIAEQHMISCAGGLAAGGQLPFVSTFGKFVMRGYDQAEIAFISRFPLKIVASHAGVSLAADGPSQMALPDVAFFRAWTTVRNRAGRPLLYLLQPADAYAAYALTLAMAEYDGPCYMRTLRPDVPFLYDDTARFHLGGHHVLAEGHDLLIVASGYMVHEARKALPTLRQQGIAASLVDLYSLPFDDDAIATLAQDHQGRVLTLEDNYGGGFGSAVADALSARANTVILHQMYVRQIPKSGRTPDDVLRYLGLSTDDIVKAAAELLATAAR
ncbi:MAG TPA: transketolase [Alphaproteobacteria bacterium]|nr:transketolase [Alphaproteobacteria bacterium]